LESWLGSDSHYNQQLKASLWALGIKVFKLKYCVLLLLFFSSFLFSSSYAFLEPKDKRLIYEFIGTSQAGEETHRLEIRKLGYEASFYNEGKVPTNGYYLIYFAGDKYGPDILTKLKGHSPFIKKISEQLVEIQFTAGNNGHTQQTWELKGHTAILKSEKKITWKERKRFDK